MIRTKSPYSMKKNEPRLISLLPAWWPWDAVALAGIIIKKRGRTLSRFTVNHEMIHFRQQRELLWVGFLVLYVVEFVVRLLANRMRWMQAYQRISFEQEAYKFDWWIGYPDIRARFCWFTYLKRDIWNFFKKTT